MGRKAKIDQLVSSSLHQPWTAIVSRHLEFIATVKCDAHEEHNFCIRLYSVLQIEQFVIFILVFQQVLLLTEPAGCCPKLEKLFVVLPSSVSCCYITHMTLGQKSSSLIKLVQCVLLFLSLISSSLAGGEHLK